MARTKGSINNHEYRWRLKINEEIKFFRTSREISRFLKISPPTLYRFIKDKLSVYKLSKLNLEIEKVEVPIFIKIKNNTI